MFTRLYRSPIQITLVACMIGIMSFPVVGGSVLTPFGGKITTYFPGCLFPPAAAVTVGPPTPMPLMYIPGASVSYKHGPPSVPGQWLLGQATTFAPCMVLCPVLFGAVPCPYAGQPGGLVILYHGSSL